MDATWTITELTEQAVAALAADGSVRVNGRVRDLPNERLVRWYTTIGLVDPPLGRRGRTALYGRRHLLQLVAVKRRQSAGRTIAEIQLELAAATDATLQRIADLPPAMDPPDVLTGAATSAPAEDEAASAIALASEPSSPTTPGPPIAQRSGGASAPPADPESATRRDQNGQKARARFWAARTDVAYTSSVFPEALEHAGAAPALVQGVRLTPDLTVLLNVPQLSGDDLAAIETAARPLLDELRRRGLIELPAETPANPSDIPPRRSQ
ncbi:MerR family transcriptional regulator [Spirillospora sp. NBC_01491]|uniref:MerR family transcriptional regulator n=1 Tax=Spirillospora sp. NBC_01491 TaxID=2976007 RepID=UPI002E371FAE|nr:MerR family transcriptional regulator [Spirillospora sp. NBC_01491]